VFDRYYIVNELEFHQADERLMTYFQQEPVG